MLVYLHQIKFLFVVPTGTHKKKVSSALEKGCENTLCGHF
jgi:hypothetical protein